MESTASLFSDKVKKAETKDGEIKELHAKIGLMEVENNFFQKAEAMSPPERRQMFRK